MKTFAHSICLILITVLVAACTNPGRVMKAEMPKNSPPDYQLGWQDGCESGLGSSYTNSWYKTFHSYKKDIRRLTNQMYVVGWDDGNRYCRHYGGQWVNWGYFDTADGSLRDKNVPEQFSFSIPGWNGVKYESGIGGAFGSENRNLVGNGKSLDTLMGWGTDAGDMVQPAKSFWGGAGAAGADCEGGC